MARTQIDSRELLFRAAMHRTLEPRPVEPPWVHGWFREDYRRSANAVVPYDRLRVVRFSSEGVEAIEGAMRTLLSSKSLRAVWAEEEVWGVVVEMVATLPLTETEAETALDSRLELLKAPGPTLVLHRLAHVRWTVPPLTLKLGCVIGKNGVEMHAEVERLSGRASLSNTPRWWAVDGDARDQPVIFAAIVQSAGTRAREEAELLLERIVEVSLLFQSDKEKRGLYSLRGDVFRPGIRGMTLDRHALEAGARKLAPELLAELAADVYQCSRLSAGIAYLWHGESPWPLDDLLADPAHRAIVEGVVQEDSSLSRRIRTSARWYARAHWAADKADALLALGIASEALLAEGGGSPGRVLAERFALLHAKTAERADAQKFFSKKIYDPRCAVAHGALASADDAPVREIERQVSWIAQRLWDLSIRDGVRSEDDHRALFDALKWGTRAPG